MEELRIECVEESLGWLVVILRYTYPKKSHQMDISVAVLQPSSGHISMYRDTYIPRIECIIVFMGCFSCSTCTYTPECM